MPRCKTHSGLLHLGPVADLPSAIHAHIQSLHIITNVLPRTKNAKDFAMQHSWKSNQHQTKWKSPLDNVKDSLLPCVGNNIILQHTSTSKHLDRWLHRFHLTKSCPPATLANEILGLSREIVANIQTSGLQGRHDASNTPGPGGEGPRNCCG